MSHFSVAVFTEEGGKTVEELLAPYQENNMGDCPEEYLEFIDVEDRELDSYKNEEIDMVKCPDGKLLYPWDERFKKNGINEVPEGGYKKVKAKFTEIYPSFDEYMEEYCGFSKDPRKNRYGYWENPNAKWDWYQVGGRWSGLLKLKATAATGSYGTRSWTNKEEIIPENRVDSAKIKDIDFSVDGKEYKKLIRFWELKVDGDAPRNEKEKELLKWDIYKREYYVDKYASKEEYARIESSFATYAVITPDGKWHEKGKMGWFGFGSESDEEDKHWNKSFKEIFIDTADPEWTLSIVDCHI
jgi:hypothetical protein